MTFLLSNIDKKYFYRPILREELLYEFKLTKMIFDI